MSDELRSGRRFRTFNVIDDMNREVLRIGIDTSLLARRLVRALDELVCLRGKSIALRIDNGQELISDELGKWARFHVIGRRFIQPSRPMQNVLIERFDRTYREDVLNSCVFETLGEMRRMTADWITRYQRYPNALVSRRSHPSTVLDGKIPIPLYFHMAWKKRGHTELTASDS